MAGTQKDKQLTTTQVGAIAEAVVASQVMIESSGRLSPFRPVADDGGIDLLIYDKDTGRSLPVQIKGRTHTLKRSNSTKHGNTVHFEVREATMKADPYAHLLGVLMNRYLDGIERAWLVPMMDVKRFARHHSRKYILRPSRQVKAKDKWTNYRCRDARDTVDRIIEILEEFDEAS